MKELVDALLDCYEAVALKAVKDASESWSSASTRDVAARVSALAFGHDGAGNGPSEPFSAPLLSIPRHRSVNDRRVVCF